MSDYRELVKSEAKKFFQAHWAPFQADGEEHGGGSERPNFSKWIDKSTKLNQVVNEVTASWGHKEFLWVQASTRNWGQKGGDPRSNAYGSFYLDVFHELKKLAKQGK